MPGILSNQFRGDDPLRIARKLLEYAAKPMLVFDATTRRCAASNQAARIAAAELPVDIGSISTDAFAPDGDDAAGETVGFDEWLAGSPDEPRVWRLGHREEARRLEFRFEELLDTAPSLAVVSFQIADGAAAHDRRLSQAASPYAEELLRSLVDESPTAFAVLDTDLRYLDWNERWLSDHHLDTDDLRGRRHYDVFDEVADECKAIHQRCLSGESLHHDEEPFVRRDGSIDYVRWNIRPWRHATGDIGGVIVVTEILTEQRLSKRRLREAESRYAAVFRLAPVAMLLIDAEGDAIGRIVDVNELAAQMHGCDADELIGSHIEELNTPTARATASEWRQRLMEGERVVYESERYRKDGRVVPIEMTAERVEIAGHSHIIAFPRDISESLAVEARLRESEQRLKLATEAAGIGIWDWYVESGRSVFSNDWRHQLGYAPHEVPNHHVEFLARLHPEDRAKWREDMARYLRGEAPRYAAELRLLHRDGTYRWVQSFGVAHLDRTAGEKRVLGCHIDITERKNAEERLRESEERLQMAAGAGGAGLWDWDMTTGVVYYSAMWMQQLGYDADEISADVDAFESRVHPDDLGPAKLALREYLDNKTPQFIIEVRLLHKDGSYRWIESRGVKQTDNDGVPIRMLGCQIDITERKLAAERLRESEDRWRTIFDNAPIAMVVLSSEGVIVASNRAAATLHDYDGDELVGASIFDIDGGDAEAPKDRIRTMLNGEVLRFNTQLKRKDGSMFSAEIFGARIMIEGEHFILGTAVDVTERLQLDTERRHHTQMLAAQAEAYPGGIIAYTADGRLFCNDRFKEMWSIDAALLDSQDIEAIAQRVASHFRQPDAFLERLRLHWNGGDVPRHQRLMTRDDRVIEHRIEPAVDKRGSAFGGVCFFLDVTKETRAESLLSWHNRALEELATRRPVESVLTTLVRGIEQSLPDVVAAVYLANGSRLRCAAAVSVPQGVVDICDGLEIGPRAFSAGTAAHRKQRVIVEDTSTHPIWAGLRGLAVEYEIGSCWSEPILSDTSEVLGTVTIYHREHRGPSREELELIESTAHLAKLCLTLSWTESAIRESEEKHRIVTETARDAIVTIDLEGRITFANRATSAIFGYAETDFLNISFQRLVPDADPWGRRAKLSEPRATWFSAVEKATGYRSDGESLTLELSYGRHEQNGAERVTVVVRDISERQAFADELRRRETELAHTARVAMLGHMLTEIAHEVNQPLNAIANFAKASRIEIDRGSTSLDTLENRFAKIDELASKGTAIIRRTRDFLKKRSSERRVCSLNDVIDQAVELLTFNGLGAGVRFDRAEDGDDLRVDGDDVQLQQVVFNLLMNSLEAIEGDGGGEPVEVSANADGDYVEVCVVDHGPGILSDQAGAVFDAFHSTKPSGMGMGLSISRTIVEAHGGRIWFTSDPGDTTRFYVRLPRSKQKARAESE